jgi:4-amino-4-deoxy-L-arabinose transferase-like glycosyltransferase
MINHPENHGATARILWILLIAVCLIRLVSLGGYPLADTTEARYGNMARLMVESGDWITPQFSLGVPFWGKPPLSFWLSSASMKVFGMGEFAARLPSFLLGIVVSVMLWHLALRQRDRYYALIAIVILNSSILFWVSSGAVMTDHSLLTATTICMVAFWRCMKSVGSSSRLWGYLFFAGLAMGLLAKGPVALLLSGIPVGGWILVTGNWRNAWQRIPWISGLLLTAALSLPWYWLAETKTPGFLEYFLVGEHWRRFLVPGWEGDLYGSAHLRPRGMIWLYWPACTLPWSIVVPLMCWRKRFRESVFQYFSRLDKWMLYLLFWAVTPMLFFTMARNILPAYVLPGLPAFALLMAGLFQPSLDQKQLNMMKTLTWTTSAMTLLFIQAFVYIAMGYGVGPRSEKELVTVFQESRQDEASRLVYIFKRPFSADFYSGGQAELAKTVEETEHFFKNGSTDHFAVSSGIYEKLPESFRDRVISIGPINRYYLLREKTPQVTY